MKHGSRDYLIKNKIYDLDLYNELTNMYWCKKKMYPKKYTTIWYLVTTMKSIRQVYYDR